ncbi:MAG: sugar ABC transporter substrate-binding protein [Lysobacterales bacterium]
MRFLCTLAALLLCANAHAEPVTLGVSMHFMRDDYAVKVVDTIEAVAAGRGESRIIVTDANATASKQLADVENLVVQNVDAIIVVPIDEKAILPGIRKANAAGIPVIAITHIPGAEVLTTVAAAGDYANGRASGELLRERLGGTGKIAVIGVPYNLWRIDERVRGFEDAIAESAIEVVARQASDDQARVQDLVAGILIAQPDLAGIWCTFSNQVVGAGDALRMAGRKGVVLTGIDADRAIIERIRRGWVTGTAAQFPAEHGRLAAEAAFDHLEGKPVQPTYEVPVGLVTQDNADEMSARIWGE